MTVSAEALYQGLFRFSDINKVAVNFTVYSVISLLFVLLTGWNK